MNNTSIYILVRTKSFELDYTKKVAKELEREIKELQEKCIHNEGLLANSESECAVCLKEIGIGKENQSGIGV